MKPPAKQFVKQFWLVRRLVGARRARQTRRFGRWWKQLLAQGAQSPGDGLEASPFTTGDQQPSSSSQPPRVLLATSLGGWQPGTRLDSVLATALRLECPHVQVLATAMPMSTGGVGGPVWPRRLELA